MTATAQPMARPVLCPTARALATMWKPCTRHPGYEVSWDGRVRNARTGHVLKPQQAKGGRYQKVNLGRQRPGGPQPQVQVHQLVAEAWHGPMPPGMPHVVDHVDNNGQRNVATNLRWSSYSMNTRQWYAWQQRLQAEAMACGADRLPPMTDPAERSAYADQWGADALADYDERFGTPDQRRQALRLSA